MLILLYGNNIRAEAEPAIAGCRIPGYVAARICDPHARPCAPWTRASGRRCRPSRLASAVARQANSAAGGERYSHSQHWCKVSRHRVDSGKDRPSCSGRPPVGPVRKYWSASPSGRAVGKYFLLCPCLRAVAVIGLSRIAVPSVSAVLELRRRRIKSAKKLWITSV